MPFLGELPFESSDDEESNYSFAKPCGRGKGKEWTLLHSYATVEEYNANYPSRDEYVTRNKVKTSTNGLICNFRCKVKNCSYSIRCIEEKLSVEFCGAHIHTEGEEPVRKRGLTNEQRCIVDRCLSMNVRGGKSIATEFITYNNDLIKQGRLH